MPVHVSRNPRPCSGQRHPPQQFGEGYQWGMTIDMSVCNGCSACVAAVCAADPRCCSSGWDPLCVTKANQRCTPCSHPTGTVGGPLFYGCNACAAKVCDADPTCCTNTWSSSCVSLSTSLCP